MISRFLRNICGLSFALLLLRYFESGAGWYLVFAVIAGAGFAIWNMNVREIQAEKIRAEKIRQQELLAHLRKRRRDDQ